MKKEDKKDRIRVVVVDDSALCRDLLRDILEEEGDIEVVGEAGDGQAAIDVVARSRAQLVTLDIEMPGMDGLLAVEQIMARTPVPILIVTGRSAEQRSHTLFEAVQRGALDLVAKPRGGSAEETSTLRALVRSLARVPVMRHLAGSRAKSPAPPLTPGAPIAPLAFPAHLHVPIVGIAASTGGPAAVNLLLSRLPPDFEGCVAVVQHMLPGFAASFVEYLRAHSRLRIHLALGPVRPKAHTVFVAPDARHLVMSAEGAFTLTEAAAGRSGYRPSADVLFLSLARTCGPNAVGVVLSGIGDDGAEGLLAMRKAGAITLAQDEASSTVYGMPRAAKENGGATYVLALEDMPVAVAHRTKQLAAAAAERRRS
jgi:two-component system chemotaxis response regulator CheB